MTDRTPPRGLRSTYAHATRQTSRGRPVEADQWTFNRSGCAIPGSGSRGASRTRPAPTTAGSSWHLEDYLEYPIAPAPAIAGGLKDRLDELGLELFDAVLASREARDLWARLREHLSDLRVEVASDVADATGLPWELLRDPPTVVRLA